MTKEARIHNGKKTVSSINGSGKTGQLHVKNKIRTFSNTTNKNKLKKDKDLRVIRPETIKLLEENIRRMFYATNHGTILFDLAPRAMTTKTKIKQWGPN